MNISFTNMPPAAVAKLLGEELGRDLSGRILEELKKQVNPVLEAVARQMAEDLVICCESQYVYVEGKTEVLLSFKENPIERFPK